MNDLIDIAELDEHTFGDPEIRREIIILFREQSTAILAALEGGVGRARGDTAHRLKGSALSIGARPLAAACGALEQSPDDPALLAQVRHLMSATLLALGKLPG